MKLELCRSRCSPYVERVQVALRLKGLTWSERYVSLVDKPAWFLDLAPTGKVPLLLIDGKPVVESSAIIELLDELYPSPPFFPTQPLDRAAVRAAVRWLDLEVFLAAYTLLDELAAYEKRADGGQRYRFEEGRVFLRPHSEVDLPAAQRARDRLALSVQRFAALVAALPPAAAESAALAVAFEPLVHNPDFAYFSDPELLFAGPAPWTAHRALMPVVAAARALPTDHIVWMYA
jgi:glutathione S-transferase